VFWGVFDVVIEGGNNTKIGPILAFGVFFPQNALEMGKIRKYMGVWVARGKTIDPLYHYVNLMTFNSLGITGNIYQQRKQLPNKRRPLF
jgi:hypothetical protein